MTIVEISKKIDEVISPELKDKQGMIVLLFDTQMHEGKLCRGINSSAKGIYIEDFKIAIEFLQDKLKENQLLSNQSIN